MNICVSSTINWNPGDEFIRYGVLYLLKNIWTGVALFYLEPEISYF